MTTLNSFETRIATDYERGFILRYLSEYCGGDSRGSLAMCRGVARKSIERVRALHGNHEEVRGEYDTLADECISKFTEKILSADEFEITITKFDGTPMTLEHSAMVAFQYACRNRAFAYMPTLTKKHKLVKLTLKQFNDSRCDHKIEPAHVADKRGEVVATISQSFGTDSGEFNPPENYYYTAPRKLAKQARQSRWIAIKNRILEGIRPTKFSLSDELRIAEYNRELSIA